MSSVVRSGKSARISGLGHAGGQVFQHVRHRDAHAANARFSAAFSGLNGDSILQMGFHVHYLRRATFMGKGQALPTLPEWAITGCLEGHRNLCKGLPEPSPESKRGGGIAARGRRRGSKFR